MSISALFRAMRPHQWVKNIFVLAAFAFVAIEAGGLDFPGAEDALIRTLYAFASFCLGSSSIYLINDILDVESDRKHPSKCKRPIAAGELSIPAAAIASVVCIAISLGLAWNLGGHPVRVVFIVAAYIVMNFAYSVKLKHIVLVDAFIIATGFLFRVSAGGVAADVRLSHWIFLCTFFLALFLALCKRRSEIDRLGEGRGETRAILLEYNQAFLDQMVTILAACTVLCYTMYTVSADTVEKFGSPLLAVTVPFVVFGLGRYLLLVQTQKGGESPTKVLLGGDVTFALNGLGWIATVVAVSFLR